MEGLASFQLLLTLFLFWGTGFASAKQCTNTFPLSSHTFRYELLTSKNESWRQEMLSHYHLTPTDDSAWSSLLPRKVLREEDEFSWAMMYRKMKNPSEFQAIPREFLNEVSLHDVSLGEDSLHWRAQQTNLEYLLMLDVDSLVWSFRKTVGLPTPGKAYGGWEDPTCELRGHFVGHYMSATALMWASTHNDTLKERMSAVVSALFDCQNEMGTGYLSAFPSEEFDRFEALKPVWAPYYTIHKILAGLLDQYTFADNAQALNMTTWMVDYFYCRVQNVILKYTVERHWQSLNEETGGMNDVLYRLFTITADDLSGFHANTHIPIVIGSQRRYEITGDPLYKAIGTFFMDIVNSSHSYATGGTTVNEHWSDQKRLASTLEKENEESCTTYNMLKVSRHLFKWTKEMAYADYYERALTNGVLSIQRGTEPGVMIYMLPLGHGDSKAKSFHGWGTKFESFWCCYGTGIESFSKLGDSIYFEEEGKVPGLYIIQYISSVLNWKSGRIMLNQKVDPVVSWDPYLGLTHTFSLEGPGQSSTLNLRIPFWTNSNGAKATLNNQNLPLPSPGNFLSVTKQWSAGDKLTLQLPISLRTEAIQDDRPEYASIQAILYGPYLLAGHSNGDWNIKTESARSNISDWITPIPSSHNDHLVTFSQESGKSSSVLTNSNKSITMEKFPQSGTDGAVHATFRLILNDSSSSKFSSVKDVLGKSVMLEPFDLPGMLVAHQGTNDKLVVTYSPNDGSSSYFRVVSGLDGRHETVSLESDNQKGCFVYGEGNLTSGASLRLSNSTEFLNAKFKQRASFVMQKGISKYHPISFVAKGANRNFVLSPLLSFRDESYAVYFKIES
ncbi:hypothetical protein LWI29_038542 [Acer saccharum]|uniref:Alpha-L-arabinofuranosidase B arabinose-binding domain-containing protein n=1 Tax=Acer saccharum TaxID=4024 RepID=A0AA39T9T0_ACESA|nr:hypothetical protein LWI29_038542 [Acer saccharum]